jgi:hypothetical protein
VLPLSIVIPTHDTRDLVERCLHSLGGEVADRFDVIVVDDGSTDGTAERLAEGFPWVRVLRHQVAQGFTASVNDGLACANGGLLLLLNSDTEVRPGSLEELLVAFERDPRLGIAGASLENPDGSHQWSAGREPSLPWLFALSSGFGRWVRERLPVMRRRVPGHSVGGPTEWVTGAAMAIRRDVYHLLGPLETAFHFYVQDMDYCLRARAVGFGVAVIPGFRVMHLGGGTVSQSAGAVGSSHPELLMLDLVTWAELRRGATWAGWARRTLRVGVCLRVALRRVLSVAVPSAHGAGYRKTTESLASAARSIRLAGRTHRS